MDGILPRTRQSIVNLLSEKMLLGRLPGNFRDYQERAEGWSRPFSEPRRSVRDDEPKENIKN
jgi:hypothetical protein